MYPDTISASEHSVVLFHMQFPLENWGKIWIILSWEQWFIDATLSTRSMLHRINAADRGLVWMLFILAFHYPALIHSWQQNSETIEGFPLLVLLFQKWVYFLFCFFFRMPHLALCLTQSGDFNGRMWNSETMVGKRHLDCLCNITGPGLLTGESMLPVHGYFSHYFTPTTLIAWQSELFHWQGDLSLGSAAWTYSYTHICGHMHRCLLM